MAFKVSSLRRDYLARDILFHFLDYLPVKDFIFSYSKVVPYEVLSKVESNLIKRCIDLADVFIQGLDSPVSGTIEDNDDDPIGASSPIILDADM